MNEESDGINESDNNNSEVVILPERSNVEELLLSDQSHMREEPSDFERKLDEKLKDLGLFEDDMTINQKEELLAVVVISCETAEQEENKRQLIREYLEGAQSLQDEIEFSLQESAWLADEANLLCQSTITRSKDSSSSKLSSFIDCESSTSGKNFEDFDSAIRSEGTSFKSTPDIFEDENAYTEISLDPHSSSSSHNDKKQMLKGRSKGNRRFGQLSSDANVKIAITHPMLQEEDSNPSKTEELLDIQLSVERENLLLDKSMTIWRPCMSPKDKPLYIRSKVRKRETVTSSSTRHDKVSRYLASFEKNASSLKKRRPSASKLTSLNKPYTLLHHGSMAKKACKLDNYDFVVGVTDKNPQNESNDSFTPCSTLTRAKSAFHRVKPTTHGRYVSFSNQNSPSDVPLKTTRSGATYGSQNYAKSEQDVSESSPEVILDDTFTEAGDTSDNYSLMRETDLFEKHGAFHDDITVNETKLPKFSNFRPDICKSNMIAPSPIKKAGSYVGTSLRPNYNFFNSPEKKSFKDEKLGNASERDYSSDSSSSLIDVETVIDEIDDLTLKRKLTPASQKPSYSKNSSYSKRMKKSES